MDTDEPTATPDAVTDAVADAFAAGAAAGERVAERNDAEYATRAELAALETVVAELRDWLSRAEAVAVDAAASAESAAESAAETAVAAAVAADVAVSAEDVTADSEPADGEPSRAPRRRSKDSAGDAGTPAPARGYGAGWLSNR